MERSPALGEVQTAEDGYTSSTNAVNASIINWDDPDTLGSDSAAQMW